MTAEEIIIAPVITEKSNRFKEKKKYIFRIDTRANKLMVKRALKELFNVHCLSCQVMIVKAKPKRVRYKKGYTGTWKKAIVTLKPGDKIQLFENV